MPNTFIAGLDLGQASDYTALAIVEIVPPGPSEKTVLDELHVRHLERFQLGTSYTAIVREVGERLKALLVAGPWELVIDRTGVGRGVFDMFKEANLEPVGISITSGDSVNPDDAGWKVPKRDLVGAVQVPLHQKRLKFAAGLPEIQILTKELLEFKVKITTSANDTYGAWREKDHDDYVLALGCACWYATNGRGDVYQGAVGGKRATVDAYQRQMRSQQGGGGRPW